MGIYSEGFADILRLIGRQIVGSEKASRGTSRAERKAAGAAETARLKREQQAGGAVLSSLVLFAAIGAAVTAGFTRGRRVNWLSVSRPEALQQAFFSGPPWVVACAEADGSKPALLAELAKLEDDRLPSTLRLGVLDCRETLPSSGLSVAKRFGLSADVSRPGEKGKWREPVLMLAANGLAPAQLPRPVAVGAQAANLARHLQHALRALASVRVGSSATAIAPSATAASS